MATIAENLQSIINAKADIHSAILERGSTPTGGLSTYAEAIRKISFVVEPVVNVKFQDLFNMNVGQQLTGTLINSNVNSGYCLGSKNDELVSVGNGFKTNIQVTTTANNLVRLNAYNVILTKESTQSSIIERTFSLSNIGTNFSQYTEGPSGYTTYNYSCPSGTSTPQEFTISFDGTYPQKIYFYVYKSFSIFPSGVPTISDDKGIPIISDGSRSTNYNDINKYVEYTLEGPTTFSVVNTYSASATFYVAFAPYVEEELNPNPFSIKSAINGMYLNVSGGKLVWSNTKTVYDIKGFYEDIVSLQTGLIQPRGTDPKDLLVFKYVNSQKNLTAPSIQNASLEENIIDGGVWGLYKIDE